MSLLLSCDVSLVCCDVSLVCRYVVVGSPVPVSVRVRAPVGSLLFSKNNVDPHILKLFPLSTAPMTNHQIELGHDIGALSLGPPRITLGGD